MPDEATSAAPVFEPSRHELPRALAVAAALTLLVGQAGLWFSIEPIATWSYGLSWWSAIFLVDALVHLRRGSSIALSRPAAFFGLAFWSGLFWLLHEVVNFRLRNWYYVGIPDDLFTRTVGVFVSFATVLPGVLEIHALLSPRSAREAARARSFVIGPRQRRALFVAGLACLLLPLAAPHYAFALIWGAGFLLLEPWLLTRDPRSLLARFSNGERGPLVRVLLAGLVSGLVWETWNWRSPAKWIYTVPYFTDGKLFEMPYLGFVGFVPFALSCHSFARALVVLRWIPEWDPEVPPTRAPTRESRRRALTAALPALLVSAAAIDGVNRFTVRSTRPHVSDIPGVPAPFARTLALSGVRTLEEFLAAAAEGGPLFDSEHVPRSDLDRWVEAARIMTIRGLGARGLAWLAGAGVVTVDHLAVVETDVLYGEAMRIRAGPPPDPTRAEVRVWIRGARDLLR